MKQPGSYPAILTRLRAACSGEQFSTTVQFSAISWPGDWQAGVTREVITGEGEGETGKECSPGVGEEGGKVVVEEGGGWMIFGKDVERWWWKMMNYEWDKWKELIMKIVNEHIW